MAFPLARRRGRIGSIAVAALLVLAGCGAVGGQERGEAGAGGRWQVHTGAFGDAKGYRSGPEVLLAAPAGCFLAGGMDNTGEGGVAATWTASGDCAHPRRSDDPAPVSSDPDAVPSGDERQVVDAVRGADGTVVAALREVYHNDSYGYDSEFLVRPPGHGWQVTAREIGPPTTSYAVPVHGSPRHVGPSALVALPAGGYVAVGRRDDANYPWYPRPVVWVSGTGQTWTERELPLPAGQPGATLTDVAVSPDGTLVAIGRAGGPSDVTQRPVAWRSTDRGQRWTPVTVPAAAGTGLSSVVAGRAGFTIVGGSWREGGPAVVLSSATGTTWVADRVAASAGVHTLRAAAVLPDGGLLATAPSGRSTGERGDQECATAWHRGTDGRWSGEDLGCHGVPVTLAVLRDGQVAAAFWSTLWLRAPAPGSGAWGFRRATFPERRLRAPGSSEL